MVLDFSDYAVANRSSGARNSVFLADARKLPFKSNSTDLLVGMDILEHLDSQGIRAALSEGCRILKPNGIFFTLIDVGDHGEEDKDKSHITIQTPQWWEDQFRDRGFKLVNSRAFSITTKLGRPFFSACQNLSRPGVMTFQKC